MAEEQTWPNQVCEVCDGKIESIILVKCMLKRFSKSNPKKFYWDEGYLCPTCLQLHVPIAMRMPVEII